MTNPLEFLIVRDNEFAELRTEIERLTAALGQICIAYRDDADANEMAEIASRALEDKT